MEEAVLLDRLKSALEKSTEAAQEWLEGADDRDAAVTLRAYLLTQDFRPEMLPAHLIPTRLRDFPVLDTPQASESLVEEYLLLRALGGEVERLTLPKGGPTPLRLGWRLVTTEQVEIVPQLAADILAEDWRRGEPGWDVRVRDATSRAEAARCLLQSPARILALSPELVSSLHAIGDRLRDVVEPGWHTPLMKDVKDAIELIRSPPRSDSRSDELLRRLVERAESDALASEIVEVRALRLAQGAGVGVDLEIPVAQLLLLVAENSPFFGADDELWAVRLGATKLPSSQVARTWSTKDSEGVRWLEWLLLQEMKLLKDWDPSPQVEKWLHAVAKRELNEHEWRFERDASTHPSASPLLARELLANFRRPWLERLPDVVRQETLGLLSDKGFELSNLRWILAAIGQEGVDDGLLAEGWRAREADPSHELRTLLACHAFDRLKEKERASLVDLALSSPEDWRVGLLVMLARAGHKAEDAKIAESAMTELLKLVGTKPLAVPAAVGLLQLVRKGDVRHREGWLQKVIDAVPSEIKADGRVAREIDLARG